MSGAIVVQLRGLEYQVSETAAQGIVVKAWIEPTEFDWWDHSTGTYHKRQRAGFWRVLRPGELREEIIAQAGKL